MTPRETAAELVNLWERKAKGELYLDALLHPVAKKWIVDAIEAAIIGASTRASKTAGSEAGSRAGSKHEEMPENTANAAVMSEPEGRLTGGSRLSGMNTGGFGTRGICISRTEKCSGSSTISVIEAWRVIVQ